MECYGVKERTSYLMEDSNNNYNLLDYVCVANLVADRFHSRLSIDTYSNANR